MTINNQIPTEKIYKDRQIWAGTMLGGPIAAGYLIAENFKAFGEADKARKTWIIAIIATIFIFGISFFAPYVDRIPNLFFVLVYTAIAYALFQLYQGEKVKTHIKAGGQIHSWWRTVGMAVIALLITIIPIIGIAVFVETVSNVEITTKTYGTLKHDIAFDKSNITEDEVDKLADGFRQTTFFDDEKQKSVDAKKTENAYEIIVYCNETIKSNPEAIGYFRKLRDEMQKLFPDNKIIFNLVIGTSDNIVKRLE